MPARRLHHGIVVVLALVVTTIARASDGPPISFSDESPQASQEIQTVGHIQSPAVTSGSAVRSRGPVVGASVSQAVAVTKAAGPDDSLTTQTRSLPASRPEAAPEGRVLPARSPPALSDSEEGKISQFERSSPSLNWESLVPAASGLAVVLGLFLAFVFVSKRFFSTGSGRLPADIIRVVGRTALTPKQTLHLVQVGDKLIVVSISPQRVETLTEITDGDEITRILAACRAKDNTAAKKEFLDIFEHINTESAKRNVAVDPAAVLKGAASEGRQKYA